MIFSMIVLHLGSSWKAVSRQLSAVSYQLSAYTRQPQYVGVFPQHTGSQVLQLVASTSLSYNAVSILFTSCAWPASASYWADLRKPRSRESKRKYSTSLAEPSAIATKRPKSR